MPKCMRATMKHTKRNTTENIHKQHWKYDENWVYNQQNWQDVFFDYSNFLLREFRAIAWIRMWIHWTDSELRAHSALRSLLSLSLPICLRVRMHCAYRLRISFIHIRQWFPFLWKSPIYLLIFSIRWAKQQLDMLIHLNFDVFQLLAFNAFIQ